MSVSTPRSRALLLVVVALVALCWTAGGAFTEGQLKNSILPIVSSSDIIGYTAPCG